MNVDTTEILKLLGYTDNELTDTNLFAYCGNNPVMNADPNRDFWFIPVLIATAPVWVPYVVAIGAIITSAALGAQVGIYRASKKSERDYNQEAEHKKKTRSKRNKHEQGQTRKKLDKGGEKGDKRRIKNTKIYVIPK